MAIATMANSIASVKRAAAGLWPLPTPLMAQEQRTLIDHLLRERSALRGIRRAVGMRLTWLLHYMVECVAACPDP